MSFQGASNTFVYERASMKGRRMRRKFRRGRTRLGRRPISGALQGLRDRRAPREKRRRRRLRQCRQGKTERNALEHAANNANITYQYVIRENDESEAAVIQKSYTGIYAGGLCVPCRYHHTAAEMVNIDDVSNSVELLYTVIMEPNLFTES